jgi:hypothetical protein
MGLSGRFIRLRIDDNMRRKGLILFFILRRLHREDLYSSRLKFWDTLFSDNRILLDFFTWVV